MEEKKARISYPGRNLSILKLKPKIDFLESKGYRFEDIISHQVIGLTIPKMEETLERLQSYGIEDVSLSMLFLFARYKRINSVHKSSLASIARILGVDEKVLCANVPTNLRKYFTLQRTDVYVANHKLLTEHGFSNGAIQKVCILLCHHPQILKRQLLALHESGELKDMTNILTDEVQLLNTLQFFIERECNFRQPILINAHETATEAQEECMFTSSTDIEDLEQLANEQDDEEEVLEKDV